MKRFKRNIKLYQYYIFKKVVGIIVALILFSLLCYFAAHFFNAFFEDKEIDDDIMNLQYEVEKNKQIALISQERAIYKNFIEEEAQFYKTDLAKDELDSISSLIIDMTHKYDNLDVEFISAVITIESGWKKGAVSSASARGLMQIVRSTGMELSKEEGLYTEGNKIEDILFDPHQNIKLGCRYLSGFGGIDNKATAVGYHGGGKYATLYNKTKNVNLLPSATKDYFIGVSKKYEKNKATINDNLQI